MFSYISYKKTLITWVKIFGNYALSLEAMRDAFGSYSLQNVMRNFFESLSVLNLLSIFSHIFSIDI